MKNNYKVYFLKSFITFLWLLFAVWTYSIVNAAWNSYVNTWDTITSTLWNDMIWRVITHDTSITTLTTADSNSVKLTWNQTIVWVKTFSNNQQVNAAIWIWVAPVTNAKLDIQAWNTYSRYQVSWASNINGFWFYSVLQWQNITTDTSWNITILGDWANRKFWGVKLSWDSLDFVIWSSAWAWNLTETYTTIKTTYWKMTILSSGNVWIWNNTPWYKLDVSWSINWTSLSLWWWTSVTWISTDWTFAANSDAKLSTEKAVKTYVDWKVGTLASTVQVLWPLAENCATWTLSVEYTVNVAHTLGRIPEKVTVYQSNNGGISNWVFSKSQNKNSVVAFYSWTYTDWTNSILWPSNKSGRVVSVTSTNIQLWFTRFWSCGAVNLNYILTIE